MIDKAEFLRRLVLYPGLHEMHTHHSERSDTSTLVVFDVDWDFDIAAYRAWALLRLEGYYFGKLQTAYSDDCKRRPRSGTLDLRPGRISDEQLRDNLVEMRGHDGAGGSGRDSSGS